MLVLSTTRLSLYTTAVLVNPTSNLVTMSLPQRSVCIRQKPVITAQKQPLLVVWLLWHCRTLSKLWVFQCKSSVILGTYFLKSTSGQHTTGRQVVSSHLQSSRLVHKVSPLLPSHWLPFCWVRPPHFSCINFNAVIWVFLVWLSTQCTQHPILLQSEVGWLGCSNQRSLLDVLISLLYGKRVHQAYVTDVPLKFSVWKL